MTNVMLMKLTEEVGIVKVSDLEVTVFESKDVKEKRSQENIAQESFLRGLWIFLKEYDMEFPMNKLINVDYMGNEMSFYFTPNINGNVDMDVVNLNLKKTHSEKKILA